ncbi:MAG: isoaspartyl peptidase/L-asparaginase [Candidatus Thermoplasmatota archaeon]|nr:isoaspartyl peptidase/L-asparaginase [Candidatus Thermoplasmatota archaeon]
MEPLIISHGGAGSPIEFKDCTEKAAQKGFKVLGRADNALKAVIEAVIVLEDDFRFNAGTGSNLRLDGKTIEMDAAVMLSNGACGAVGAIKNVKNPVKVAAEVLKIPHVLLVGEHATKFARKCGFKYYNPITEKAVKKLEDIKKKLKSGNLPKWAEKWRNFRYSRFLVGTVGAVARSSKEFAAAVSTGGTSLMLPGRVGDSAVIGAGIYAGKKGAVCTTGVGEEIIRNALAKTVYDKLEELGSQEACEWGVKLLKKYPTGIIAVTKKGYGMACSENMACTAMGKNFIKSGVR